MRASLIFLVISWIEGKSLSNNDGISVYNYANVAKWGPSNKNDTKATVQRGRSNSGHALWPHSSDVNYIQTQHSKQNVVKQFPVYTKPSSRLDNVKVERVPGIGEVIQDRFNVRPAFSYTQIPPRNQDSATYGPPKTSSSVPPAAFPAVFNVPPAAASAKPPVDLYTSPYSSYNPPNIVDSYAAPPSDDDGPYSPPDMPTKTTAATLGPPLSPHHHHHVGEVDVYPSDHDGDYPMPKDGGDIAPPDHPGDHHMPKHGGDMPPDTPPKSIDDIYYPPDFPEDQQQQKAADMTADLNPPASHAALDHHFPQYLYDNPHYDHHVYEEIPHPTTTEATEKRVSSTHYSYYYLGRKLWYIPLYFSIYFMVYVTVLILKSIARHKVELRDDWSSSHSRSARQLKLDHVETLETVDHLHRNITAALDSAHKLYNTIM